MRSWKRSGLQSLAPVRPVGAELSGATGRDAEGKRPSTSHEMGGGNSQRLYCPRENQAYGAVCYAPCRSGADASYLRGDGRQEFKGQSDQGVHTDQVYGSLFTWLC